MNMRGAAQNKVAVVVLILVIGIAIAFVIKAARPTRYQAPDVDWVCLECDHAFVAPGSSQSPACPKCAGESARRFMYYDSENDVVFEAYRRKNNPDASPDDPAQIDEMYLYKAPGGEWTTREPEDIVSPDGVSDWDKLEYCPPDSEHRE